MIILSANRLSKVYGTDVILQDVSFHVNAGDRVGIVGRNGACLLYTSRIEFSDFVMRAFVLAYPKTSGSMQE